MKVEEIKTSELEGRRQKAKLERRVLHQVSGPSVSVAEVLCPSAPPSHAPYEVSESVRTCWGLARQRPRPRQRPGREGPRGTHRELAHLPAVHPAVLRLGRDGIGQFLEEKGPPWAPAQRGGWAQGDHHTGGG